MKVRSDPVIQGPSTSDSAFDVDKEVLISDIKESKEKIEKEEIKRIYFKFNHNGYH